MRSARQLYRFGIAVGLAGLAASALAFANAVGSVSLGGASLSGFARACSQFVLPNPSGGSLLVLGLLGLGALVAMLAARSLWRQLRAHHRLIKVLPPNREACVAGESVRLIVERRSRAFCAGHLRPRTYVSTGSLDTLTQAELQAVLAHERHHARRRDPLRILMARVLADALFFLPVLSHLAERYATLAEVAADDAAARQVDRQALASALLAFGETPSPRVVMGIAPERVDHLLGDPPRWQLPVSMLAGSLLALAALIALGLSTAAMMGGAKVDLAVLAAQSCMLAMAVVPIAIGFVALVVTRRANPRAR